MKSDKILLGIYNKAKGNNTYYSFESFKEDARDFLKDVKKGKTVYHIVVSRSVMSRKFNFYKYNNLLNLVYNEVFSWDPVKVGGCGMDMHWHLKYSVCEALFTKKEIEKHSLNSACSSGRIL